MIELANGRLVVRSPMLMDNARTLLEAGCSFFQQGETVIDLSAVAEADSSALAVMLGWVRFAGERGVSLRFSGIPESICSLADLYGITDIFPHS